MTNPTPKKVYIETLGCQMNFNDSEVMLGLLRKEGFEPTKNRDEADLLIVNTCQIRGSAEDKAYSQMGYWKKLKRKNPGIKIAMAGCVAQQAKGSVFDRIPHADIVFGTQNIQDLYLDSLQAIGVDPAQHDIRFVEDDWESPTLGAWGLGWEVWCDGMEVTQFTYFQQMGGFDCRPVAGELTYGLERLAMYVQNVDSVYDLDFNGAGVSYGDVFLENERQMSKWNFEVADTEALFDLFRKAAAECENCLAAALPIPAYEQAIKASHVFNLLNARGVISVAERQAYIGRVRDLAKGACQAWMDKNGWPA
mgnify:CR=1 FL=1